MKTYFLSLVLLLAATTLCGQYDSIPFDNYQRSYLLHLPSGYDGEEELPLIIAMHGGFGNAYNMENQSLLSEKADAENFIVVYPEGVPSPLNIRTWNAGGCCGFASNTNIDDVGFIDALIDTLIDNYAIDYQRVYATGMSNGGFMSYRLACELSNRITAIASVACSMLLDSCNPERPVPVIQFHSFLDQNVPFDGGYGSGPSIHYNPPQDSIMHVWASNDTCLVNNEIVVISSEYEFTKWSNCSCEAEVHHYISYDGGHSWPGGTATLFGDPVSEFINANDLMWDFFSNYQLDCDAELRVGTYSKHTQLFAFPNPTTGKIQFDLSVLGSKTEIEVRDLLGVVIYKSKNREQLDLTSFPEGVYYILIENKGQYYNLRIVKIND